MAAEVAEPAAAAGASADRPLLGLGREALEQWAVAHGQAAFRGRQLHDWLYAKGVRRLGDVSVLPKAFREQLEASPPPGAADWIGRSRELHRSVAATSRRAPARLHSSSQHP